MSNDINIHRKYQPLFRSNTRYTIVTGGRGSGKSFALACAVLNATYEDGCNILYTRYTLVSAEVSIIPEYTEKLELMERTDDFTVRRREVQNDMTGATILFRGLKASSKNQIAKLKSLNRIKTWILDEAQELMDESLFDTIDLSIRDKDAENRVILVLNPADISHWIYRRFFKEAGVPEDFNGVKGNVTYIHTTYEDNLSNLDEGFIDIAEAMKERNEEKWGHIFGGQWLIRKAGIIYPRWEEIRPEEYPIHLEQWYGNDWGYGGDPNALIRMCYDALTQTIYLWEVCCTQLITTDVAKVIKADAEKIGYEPEDCLVYCDPARPDNIAQLRRSGISAVKAVNRDKSGRISYLQGFRVRYVGATIRSEVQTYSWQPHPMDSERFTDTPQDGNDHCFTADTMIFTRGGNKSIADIRKGEEVLTSQGWRNVLETWDNGFKEVLCVRLNFNGFSICIEATPNHLFKTDKGWKQLQSLQKGDRLFLLSDSTEGLTASMRGSNTADCLAVQGIELLSVRRERVYDLTVEDSHEYYANGILVHNCMDAVSYGAVTHLRRLCILNEDGEG